MKTFLFILIILAAIGALVSVIRGVIYMLRTTKEDLAGPGPNRSALAQNRMMWRRIQFQAIAVILAVFLLQGGLVGLAGSLLGVALAYGLLVFFSRIFKSPDGSPMFTAQLAPALALQATLLACLVGVLAAVIPARRAARMDPVQAIRT